MIISMSCYTVRTEHFDSYTEEKDYSCGYPETYKTTFNITSTSLDESTKIMNGIMKELGEKLKVGIK